MRASGLRPTTEVCLQGLQEPDLLREAQVNIAAAKEGAGRQSRVGNRWCPRFRGFPPIFTEYVVRRGFLTCNRRNLRAPPLSPLWRIAPDRWGGLSRQLHRTVGRSRFTRNRTIHGARTTSGSVSPLFFVGCFGYVEGFPRVRGSVSLVSLRLSSPSSIRVNVDMVWSCACLRIAWRRYIEMETLIIVRVWLCACLWTPRDKCTGIQLGAVCTIGRDFDFAKT